MELSIPITMDVKFEHRQGTDALHKDLVAVEVDLPISALEAAPFAAAPLYSPSILTAFENAARENAHAIGEQWSPPTVPVALMRSSPNRFDVVVYYSIARIIPRGDSATRLVFTLSVINGLVR